MTTAVPGHRRPGTNLTLGDLAGALRDRDIPHYVCGNPSGRGVFIAMTGGARILALGADIDSRSVFWWDPRILDRKDRTHILAGAVGGERLWFAPECRYHWKGRPDWNGFSNYEPSSLTDPGRYEFTALAGGGGSFEGRIGAADHERGRTVRAAVVKTVRFLQSDGSAQGGFGIEVRTELEIEPNDDHSPMDLWSIVQIPPQSRLEVPLREPSAPLAYSPGGNWYMRDATLRWNLTGTENAKLGLGAGQVTGRAYAHFDAEEAACRTMTVSFPFSQAEAYCDSPFGIPRDDQVFQAWDGFGFGEIEIHSPAAFAEAGRNRTAVEYQILCIERDAAPSA